MNDIKYNIAETDEYAKLVEFMIANQLEFTEEDAEEVPTDLVKCWEITDSAGNLIGGFVLAKRQGEYICDGIAVDGSRRGENLGTELLNKGIEETKSLGGRRMYLVARAPEFFRKNGFVTIPREEAPNFFECLTCPQYGKTCHPEVMKIEF
ncbi:MAG: GNAT family N-acetyltransferase [Clostridiales bacterium]|nr:GNAT family N-acetyltransferase [Clostridiales bacterium]MDD6980102.1 GNAT family N-acetyltransferase [Bacillota bacterium]MDY6174586.1 GNAT family N-acetyltransferase [Lentihominibacter sp.]